MGGEGRCQLVYQMSFVDISKSLDVAGALCPRGPTVIVYLRNTAEMGKTLSVSAKLLILKFRGLGTSQGIHRISFCINVQRATPERSGSSNRTTVSLKPNLRGFQN